MPLESYRNSNKSEQFAPWSPCPTRPTPWPSILVHFACKPHHGGSGQGRCERDHSASSSHRKLFPSWISKKTGKTYENDENSKHHINSENITISRWTIFPAWTAWTQVDISWIFFLNISLFNTWHLGHKVNISPSFPAAGGPATKITCHGKTSFPGKICRKRQFPRAAPIAVRSVLCCPLFEQIVWICWILFELFPLGHKIILTRNKVQKEVPTSLTMLWRAIDAMVRWSYT